MSNNDVGVDIDDIHLNVFGGDTSPLEWFYGEIRKGQKPLIRLEDNYEGGSMIEFTNPQFEQFVLNLPSVVKELIDARSEIERLKEELKRAKYSEPEIGLKVMYRGNVGTVVYCDGWRHVQVMYGDKIEWVKWSECDVIEDEIELIPFVSPPTTNFDELMNEYGAEIAHLFSHLLPYYGTEGFIEALDEVCDELLEMNEKEDDSDGQ